MITHHTMSPSMSLSLLPLVVMVFALQLHLSASVPYQRCTIGGSDCQSFCSSYGYNSSECGTKGLRLSRICQCSNCDVLLCATYCTKHALKFVGCSCLVFPSAVGYSSGSGLGSSADNTQLLTNECYDNKFYCQCSK